MHHFTAMLLIYVHSLFVMLFRWTLLSFNDFLNSSVLINKNTQHNFLSIPQKVVQLVIILL